MGQTVNIIRDIIGSWKFRKGPLSVFPKDILQILLAQVWRQK